MKEKAYVIVFTIAVTAFFGGLVSAVNAALTERIQRNQVVAEQRVVLDLIGVDTSALDDEAVVARFGEAVEVRRYDAPDQVRPYTIYAAAGGAAKAVIPIYGQGFWAPIQGFLALDTATGEVGGIAFTDQAETPGLGGRIVEPAFRAQFETMRLDLDAAKRSYVTLTPPDSPNGSTEFDAITGATETSRSLERILNQSIRRYLSVTDGAAPAARGDEETTP